MSNMLSVPPLSLATQSTDFTDFAAAFGGSFQRFGFAVVADHGIDAALIDRAWVATKSFFAQSVPDKMAYRAGKGGQRGYIPFGIEMAKGATENDLKEFWHIGRDLPPGHKFADHMPQNIWPAHPPEFRDIFIELYAEFDKVGAKLLSAIAVYLGLDKEWFVEPVRDGNSVLRLLHYPPVSCAQARTRISISSRCCWGPKRRGCSCSTETAIGWRSILPEAPSSSMSATCSSG